MYNNSHIQLPNGTEQWIFIGGENTTAEYSWTKPATKIAKLIHFAYIYQGGNGGTGWGGSGTAGGGGGGGGGGAFVGCFIPSILCPDNLTILVPDGGSTTVGGLYVDNVLFLGSNAAAPYGGAGGNGTTAGGGGGGSAGAAGTAGNPNGIGSCLGMAWTGAGHAGGAGQGVGTGVSVTATTFTTGAGGAGGPADYGGGSVIGTGGRPSVSGGAAFANSPGKPGHMVWYPVLQLAGGGGASSVTAGSQNTGNDGGNGAPGCGGGGSGGGKVTNGTAGKGGPAFVIITSIP